MQLTGDEFAQLSAALGDSHRDYDDLGMTLRRADQRIANITNPGPLPMVIMAVLEYAETRDWVDQLVAAARASNPNNVELYTVAVAMGLEPGGVTVSEDGKSALADATAHLERLVDPARGFTDAGSYVARMQEFLVQVCAVELGEKSGTGFLIGPETVLTNYHVVKDAIEGSFKPADIRVRFDYRKLRDGLTTSAGIEVEPASDWLVDYEPYSTVDSEPYDEQDLPEENELDYAVIRTMEKVGLAPPPGPLDIPRGWIEPIGHVYDFPLDSFIRVIQHPCHDPLKLDDVDDAVVRVNGNGTRVHYRTNTMPGSSGSPVLNGNLDLVALHHSGEPGTPDFELPCQKQVTPAEYNEGIPIASIQNQLASKDLSWVFGGEAP